MIVFGFLFESSLSAYGKPLVFVSTLPELSWMAAELAGEEIETKSLLSGSENPHYLDAVPEFVRLSAEADIFCSVGLDLEIGYLPAVLSRSANANVQSGGKGFCEVGPFISVLEKPHGTVDRSMGDIHPSGNPHFYLSPNSMAEAAKGIEEVLARVRPLQSDQWKKNLVKLTEKLREISKKTSLTLSPFTQAPGGLLAMEYHREFAYFFKEYEIKSFGSIEEKPGVPPSAGHLARVALAAKDAQVQIVLAADYSPRHVIDRFAELSGIPVVVVPTLIQTKGSLNTYATLQNHIAVAILEKLRESKSKLKKSALH